MKETRQFSQLEAHESLREWFHGEGRTSWTHLAYGKIEYLTVGERNVAYRTVSTNGHPRWVLVPGFKASKVYRTPSGQSAIDIELIPEGEQKEQIRQLLKQKLGIANERTINFWPAQ